MPGAAGLQRLPAIPQYSPASVTAGSYGTNVHLHRKGLVFAAGWVKQQFPSPGLTAAECDVNIDTFPLPIFVTLPPVAHWEARSPTEP